MTILDAFTDDQKKLLAPHLRRAFIPTCEPGAGTGPTSHIGGTPWLPEGAEWPTCPNCERPMQLMLQLDLRSLPEGAGSFGRGLAQFFYCTNNDPLCEVDCEAFFPFARSMVLRVVDPTAAGRDAEAREVPNALEPQRIVAWTSVEDLPNSEELEQLGVDVGYDTPLYDALVSADVPRAGDKLGGWPRWGQGLEYPACPECGATMRLVFQIDSGDQVGIQWGDSGTGHVTQCPEHLNQLAFGWACG